MFLKNKIIATVLVLSIIFSQAARSQVAAIKTNTIFGGELVGRWDLTVLENGKEKASWLEIEISGFKTLIGRFVASGGSARPISKIILHENKFSFAIPPQWESVEKDMVLEGEYSNAGINGVIHQSDGKVVTFTGTVASDLTKRKVIVVCI